jgi:hypothetical protein
MQGIGGKAAGHPFVHDHYARTGANLPAACVVYPVHRLLVHQEECITVSLNAGLQAIGGGCSAIASARLTVEEKDALAFLRTKDEPGFDYLWKDKNGD